MNTPIPLILSSSKDGLIRSNTWFDKLTMSGKLAALGMKETKFMERYGDAD